MAGVLQRWQEAQAASDQLWRAVKPEALYERPVPERHRLVFYLGHLEAFDWNLLAPALELKPFHAEWDKLFAFGIDPVDGALPSDPPSAWPAIGEVGDYNRNVRQRLSDALARQGGEAVAQRLEVALEHRWMHVETLSYLFHNLPYEHKQPGPAPRQSSGAVKAATAPVGIPAGCVTLGQNRRGAFGWDNEFPAHTEPVTAFLADRYKVTNGDYLAFVNDGAAPPHFWTQHDATWFYHGMFGEVPLPLDQPVYVTHAEATAYCRWKGARLPSEAEWHRMTYGTRDGSERSFPWGEAAPQRAAGNFDLRGWDPASTTAFPEAASAWGVEDLVGNGWEWTATPFAPFPGFSAFDFYPGYSANFFDGKHFVMKGGSARTAACLLRRSFRNWFQPSYPYVYAGFRCVS
ncbi:MAG: ergothioneine biosynthesis protein EgtB [Acidobacteria bacterium]|nr:MAG: ergothioneine biosynthesis protein EgtB [Acidobacteriota bacterium]